MGQVVGVVVDGEVAGGQCYLVGLGFVVGLPAVQAVVTPEQ